MSTKTTKQEPGMAESLRREAGALAASVDADSGALKEAVERLLACEDRKDAERPGFELKAVKVCLERRDELPSDEEENPLDDDERLDEIGRQLFGPHPMNRKANREPVKQFFKNILFAWFAYFAVTTSAFALVIFSNQLRGSEKRMLTANHAKYANKFKNPFSRG